MWTTARRLTSCSLKISSSQPRWTALPRTIPGLTRWRCRLFSMASLLKQWKLCWAWRRNHAWCPIFCRVAIPSLIFLLQHNDWKSVERVCVGIVQMCHQCKDTVALNENVVVLAKRCGSAALSIEPVWPALQPIRSVSVAKCLNLARQLTRCSWSGVGSQKLRKQEWCRK